MCAVVRVYISISVYNCVQKDSLSLSLSLSLARSLGRRKGDCCVVWRGWKTRFISNLKTRRREKMRPCHTENVSPFSSVGNLIQSPEPADDQIPLICSLGASDGYPWLVSFSSIPKTNIGSADCRRLPCASENA